MKLCKDQGRKGYQRKQYLTMMLYTFASSVIWSNHVTIVSCLPILVSHRSPTVSQGPGVSDTVRVHSVGGGAGTFKNYYAALQMILIQIIKLIQLT